MIFPSWKHRSRGWLLACLAGILMGVGLYGCAGSGTPQERPLADGELSPWGHCFPVRASRSIYVGANPVSHSESTPAVVDGVTLDQNDGIEVVQAWLVPLSSEPGVDRAFATYDPTDVPGWEWPSRQLVPGATLSEQPGDVDLIMEIRTDRRKATSQAIDVTYHIGDREYVARIPTRYTLVTEGKCPARP